MTDIKLFENPEFGQVRVLLEDGEPLFVGVDVASILGYKEPHKAIVRHIEEVDRMKRPVSDNQGFTRDMWVVNESGLYSLIFSSELLTARSFKRWVTSEVLPSIRKTGSYSVKPMTAIEMLAVQAQAMVELERKQIEQELRLSATETKVNEIVYIQEKNLNLLNALPLADEEVISLSPRQELNQLVRTYAQSANIEYNQVWNKIYSELYYRYHISLNAYKKAKGENNLDIAEKIGAIDKLKVIVSSLIKEIGKVRPLVKK